MCPNHSNIWVKANHINEYCCLWVVNVQPLIWFSHAVSGFAETHNINKYRLPAIMWNYKWVKHKTLRPISKEVNLSSFFFIFTSFYFQNIDVDDIKILIFMVTCNLSLTCYSFYLSCISSCKFHYGCKIK